MTVSFLQRLRPLRTGRKRGDGRVPAALLGLVPALLCAGLAWWEPFSVRALRDLVFDGYQRLVPRRYDPQVPVRVVAIDDELLNRIGQWPWPRARLAEIVTRITTGGAGAVALDVLFAEPERRPERGEAAPGDDALAQALRSGRTVLGTVLTERGASIAPKASFAFAGDDPRLHLPRFGGAVGPLAELANAAPGVGALNVTPDRDLVIREIPTLFAVGDVIVPSLDLEALRVGLDAAAIIVRSSNGSATVGASSLGAQSGISGVKIGPLSLPTARDGSMRIHFTGTQAQRDVPAWRVLAGEVPNAAFEGALVLVGITAAGFDVRATPLEATVPGVDIRAEMIESLLTGRHLTRPDYMAPLEAAMVLTGGLFAAAAASRLTPLGAAIVTITLVCLFLGLSAVAFLRLQELLNPVWPSLGAIASLGVATLAVLRVTERERRQIREAFSRYVSPNVVEVLSRDPSRLTLGGENRILTVLFSDIRNFTSMSEEMPAHEVVHFLNTVHTPMTEHVLESGGTLDKFIGDGMMAFWNAPLDHPDHVRAALRTALRMEKTVDWVNEQFAAEASVVGRPHAPLGIGIGIHTGMACIGNIGSARRFDYSAIGDTVNTSARLEPMCKTYGVNIVVSSDIVAAAPEFAYLLLDSVNLKGKAQQTRLYALVGDEAHASAGFSRFRQAHDEAVDLAVARHEDARERLRACLDDPHGERCARLYAVLQERLSLSLAAAEA